MEWLVVKTVLSLAAVLGLMFVLVLALKKFVYRGANGRTDSVEIEVLGQRMLQPRRSVHVLRVMDKIVVVGMTEHGMHALTELSGPEVTAKLAARREAARREAARREAARRETARRGTAPARAGWLVWFNRETSSGVKTFAGQLQQAIGVVGRKAGGRQRAPQTGGEQ